MHGHGFLMSGQLAALALVFCFALWVLADTRKGDK
jgi:hypothetical protein